MSYTYKSDLNGVEQVRKFSDVLDALDNAFGDFDSHKAAPISINNQDHTLVLDREVMLQAWRNIPERQMAALAEEHALAILQLKEDYDRELNLLTETFKRKLASLAQERDRRRDAYNS